MRTTVNLDADLLRRAKAQAARKGASLSSFVADAIREALAARRLAKRSRPVRLPTVRGKLVPGVNYDSFAELSDLASGTQR